MTPAPHATQPARLPQATPGWPGKLYFLITLAACLYAFTGLSSSSFWADELFTMQVVDHHQGLGEVFRRVLADVHPPLYDFVLYGWIALFGTGEAAARLLSAILAVASISIFALGVRRRLTPAAIAFACAVATTSMFWYNQAQNARDYTLAITFSAALLAVAIPFHQRMRSTGKVPAGLWLGLTLLGIGGSQSHPYMLLTVGVMLLFLLLTSRTWSQRIAVSLSGLVVLGLYVGLLWLMTHTTKHDFQDTWFHNSAAFFGSHLRRAVFHFMSRQALLIIVAMLLVLWLGRPRSVAMDTEERHIANWAAGLCGFVCVGVILSGIAVSLLVAPSFSYRNVLVCAPFGWFLVARLYEACGPRATSRLGAVAAVAIVALLGSQLIALMRGRSLPSNEPWRASAAYVQGLPGCAGVELPVIAYPGTYGVGLTPGVHAMVEKNYYGYYLPPSYRPHAYFPDAWLQRATEVAQTATTCPELGWVLHDLSDEVRALALAKQLAARIASHQLVVQEFVAYDLSWLSWKPRPGAFVFLRATPATIRTPASLPNGTDVDRNYSLGDRVWVSFDPSTSAYEVRRLHP